MASTTLAGTDAAGGIDQWGEYSEYGTPTGTPQPGIGYGWLGTHERATLTSLGITLRGARLYNQTTGLFTSPDPVHGGNETAYGYPNDPINYLDTTGEMAQAALCALQGSHGGRFYLLLAWAYLPTWLLRRPGKASVGLYLGCAKTMSCLRIRRRRRQRIQIGKDIEVEQMEISRTSIVRLNLMVEAEGFLRIRTSGGGEVCDRHLSVNMS